MSRVSSLVGSAALLVAMAGAVLAFLETQSLIVTSFAWLYVFAAAQGVVLVGTIILASRAFSKQYPLNDPSSLVRIFRLGPVWAQLVAVVGVVASVAFLVLAVGGSVHITDWEAARPVERAAMFVGFGVFALLALPAALAVRERAA